MLADSDKARGSFISFARTIALPKLAFFIVVLHAAYLAQAFGQDRRVDLSACLNRSSDDNADLDKPIAACLGVISDRGVSAHVRALAHLQRAMMYVQRSKSLNGRGEIDRAIADLSEGIRLDPDDMLAKQYALQVRAGLHVRKMDYESALADYTALITMQPGSASLYDSRGLVYTAKDDLRSALADFSKAISLEPKVALFYIQRARLFLRLGNPEKGLPDIARALELQPDDSALYVIQTLIFRALGRLRDATAALHKAALLDPTNEVFSKLTASNPAPIDQKQCLDSGADRPADIDKRIEACFRVVGDSLVAADVRAEAYLRRALAYAQRAQQTNHKDDIDRAIGDLSEGLRLDDNASARRFVYQTRAGLYFRNGDYDRAIADYTNLLGQLPDAAAVYGYRGIVFAAKGDHERAVADFAEAIRREPKTAGLYGQRAVSYLRLGKQAEALADADRAVALEPDQPAFYATRIAINRPAGKSREVIDDLRTVLSLDPFNEKIKKELAEQIAASASKPDNTASADTDANAGARRDYELAERIGTLDGWQAYLKNYKTGFYAALARAQLAKLAAAASPERAGGDIERAERERLERERAATEQAERTDKDRAPSEETKSGEKLKTADLTPLDAPGATDLAKVQLKKIAAEEVQAAAADKARLAEQERARLATEGAKQAEQARAAAALKAAEEARLAAEKTKLIEQEKAAAAEKARVAAEKAAAEKKEQLAALAPTEKPEQQTQIDLPRALQAELRRVGCNPGQVDGNWNMASRRALDLFNRHAGMKLDVNAASGDALDAVKGKTGRVCPLICEFGYKADGDRCMKIVCRAGYELNDEGACEKTEVKKPIAKREEPKVQRDKPQRAKVEAAPSKPQASGEIVCSQAGCRPLARGCRLGTGRTYPSGPTNNVEVCN